jgi:Arc/MetJ-type ribon-helix-helix transcriptional regulator
MSSLHLVAVKLTKKQLRALDAEVKRRRRSTFDVTASRSSVLREALEKLMGMQHESAEGLS